jgi:hypothetical protein
MSKTVQKSFIFRSVLLSGSSTMEDVWSAYQVTSLQPVVLVRMLKQRFNLCAALRLPRERSVKVCRHSLSPSFPGRVLPSTCFHGPPLVRQSAFLDSLDYRVLLPSLRFSLSVCIFLTCNLHSFCSVQEKPLCRPLDFDPVTFKEQFRFNHAEFQELLSSLCDLDGHSLADANGNPRLLRRIGKHSKDMIAGQTLRFWSSCAAFPDMRRGWICK